MCVLWCLVWPCGRVLRRSVEGPPRSLADAAGRIAHQGSKHATALMVVRATYSRVTDTTRMAPGARRTEHVQCRYLTCTSTVHGMYGTVVVQRPHTRCCLPALAQHVFPLGAVGADARLTADGRRDDGIACTPSHTTARAPPSECNTHAAGAAGCSQVFLGAPDNPNAAYRREFNQLPSLVCPTREEERAAKAAVKRVVGVLQQQLPKPNRVRANFYFDFLNISKTYNSVKLNKPLGPESLADPPVYQGARSLQGPGLVGGCDFQAYHSGAAAVFVHLNAQPHRTLLFPLACAQYSAGDGAPLVLGYFKESSATPPGCRAVPPRARLPFRRTVIAPPGCRAVPPSFLLLIC